MKVKVLLFGPAAHAAGRSAVDVEVDGDVTGERVKLALGGAAPEIAGYIAASRIAINAEFATPGQHVRPGDEVALIGMVSGG